MITATRQTDVVAMPVERIDGTTAARVRALLYDAIDGARTAAPGPPGEVIADLSGVQVVDAVGLGVLVGAHHRAAQDGTRFRLRAVPVRVARVLYATRLTRLLPVESRHPEVAITISGPGIRPLGHRLG